MTNTTVQKNLRNIETKDIFKDYPWFYSNIYEKLIKYTDNFFQHNFEIRFMGVSNDNNTLFFGDEYFVNKIPINKSSDFKIKISSGVIEYILDIALGRSENKFELKSLTDIEAMLVQSYLLYLYKNIQDALDKTEVSRQTAEEAENINFTFFVKNKNTHIGKIIISIPEYVLPDIQNEEAEEKFSLNDFKNTHAEINIGLGKTKITLNDIKAIEEGDIIVLEDSDINKMYVLWNNNEVSFNITPDPSLIISIDSNGGKEMEEETSTKSQNMWDSILVDVAAEFDNVKLTLGELKQISEGLVIDVGSVYDNKVKLRVENQVVATGELVILNDRYGVRIENVKKTKETQKPAENKKPETKPAAPKKEKAEKPQPQKEGDENFDYSDFEIEDESI